MSGSDQEADFVDYVDSLQRSERIKAQEARGAEMREDWRRTTWAGALIATVERVGLAPFFESVGNSFEGGADVSTTYYATSLFARIASIAAGILGVYAIGRLMKMIMGDEIVVEQEIVIVEKITKAEAEALAGFKASDEKSGASDDEVPIKEKDAKVKNRRGKHSRS